MTVQEPRRGGAMLLPAPGAPHANTGWMRLARYEYIPVGVSVGVEAGRQQRTRLNGDGFCICYVVGPEGLEPPTT